FREAWRDSSQAGRSLRLRPGDLAAAGDTLQRVSPVKPVVIAGHVQLLGSTSRVRAARRRRRRCARRSMRPVGAMCKPMRVLQDGARTFPPPRDLVTFSAMPASSTAPRILVADDEPDVLEALKLLLNGDGYEVQAATSP